MILCVLLSAFVVFSFSDTTGKIIVLFSIPLSILLAVLMKSKRRILLTLTVTVFISVLSSYLYFDVNFYPNDLYERQIYVEGEITSVSKGKNTTSVIIETSSIDNSNYSRYNFLSYINNDEAQSIRLGDKVSFECVLERFSDNTDFDSKSYYTARGVCGIARIKDTISVRNNESDFFDNINTFLDNFRHDIISRSMLLSDRSSGGILSALLLGNKRDLPGDLALDFRVLGISHILALSGMHLAILSLGIDKLLSLFRIKRKLRVSITIAFIFAYMALTGFPISVVRAGIMLTVTLVLYLLSSTHDSVTSLFVAVTLIVILSPYAIYDISLWLSAFATLGVVMLGELSNNKRARSKAISILRALVIAVLSSMFAIAATILLSATTFKTLSLMSIVSTLIFSPLCELIMYIGSIMLILGDVLPLGWALSALCNLVRALASSLSSIDGIYLSTDYLAPMLLILIFTVLFFAFLVLKVKYKRIFTSVLMIFLCVIYSVTYLNNQATLHRDDAVYLADNSDSKLLLKSEGYTAMISSAAFSSETAYSARRLLNQQKILKLDAYCFTHYTYGLINEITEIKYAIKVDRIYLPFPRNEDEESIARQLTSSLEESTTVIEYYNDGGYLNVGGFRIHPLVMTEYGKYPNNYAFDIKYGSVDYLYLSSGILSTQYSDYVLNEINRFDAVIFGSHGMSYSPNYYLSRYHPGLRRLVIGSDNMYMTPDLLMRYELDGADVISNPDCISIFLPDLLNNNH